MLETAARDHPDMAGIFIDTRSDEALTALRKLTAQAAGPAQALR
jgi:hypothetical protein